MSVLRIDGTEGCEETVTAIHLIESVSRLSLVESKALLDRAAPSEPQRFWIAAADPEDVAEALSELGLTTELETP